MRSSANLGGEMNLIYLNNSDATHRRTPAMRRNAQIPLRGTSHSCALSEIIFYSIIAMSMKKNKHILVSFLTLIILIATLYIPQEINNEITLKAVRSGFPFPFLTGDCSQYDPPFPWKFTALCGTWGEVNITGFSWMNFIFSYVLIFLIINLVFWIITMIFKKIRKK